MIEHNDIGEMEMGDPTRRIGFKIRETLLLTLKKGPRKNSLSLPKSEPKTWPQQWQGGRRSNCTLRS